MSEEPLYSYPENDWTCFTDDEYLYYDDDEEDQPNANTLDLNISPEQLPSALSSQISLMDDLQKQIDKAKEAVEKAKGNAVSAHHKVGFAKKKKAIEELQVALVEQSEAMLSEDAALRLLFANQKKLATISQGLLVLGMVNMAQNRTVYQRLKDELTNASESEISEHAKEELKRILNQLKAQEDIYNKLERNSEKIKNLENDISQIKETVESIAAKQTVVNTTGNKETTKVDNKSKILVWISLIISICALLAALL